MDSSRFDPSAISLGANFWPPPPFPDEPSKGNLLWAPPPPSQEAAAQASGFTKVGLAQLRPDLFGHLVAPEPNPQTSANDARLRPDRPQPYNAWTLPDGEAVIWDDKVEGPNVVYHHGSLGGVAGVFVDNPSDPDRVQSVFTPSGLDPTKGYGFSLSPEIGPAGEPYYDQTVWQSGPHQAVLRVDAHGRPIKALLRDTGEVHEAAISPFDVLGPIGPNLAVKGVQVGLRPIAEILGTRFGSAIGQATVDDATEAATEAVIQRGGAHALVRKHLRGIPDYESHHVLAQAISPISKPKGPAIAMLKEDHLNTPSWGSGDEATAYRQRQAGLLQLEDYEGAIQMELDAIRSRFGAKYDRAIEQMLEYARQEGWVK